MENISKNENRENVYQFLIDSYRFKVENEKNYADKWGNFYIYLTGEFFLLRYYSDRNFLSVEIASKDEPENWYALSFIRDLIYNPEVINADETVKDNSTRIEGLNTFLREDFNTIGELFSKANYTDTKKRLDEGLKKQFFLKHPTAK